MLTMLTVMIHAPENIFVGRLHRHRIFNVHIYDVKPGQKQLMDSRGNQKHRTVTQLPPLQSHRVTYAASLYCTHRMCQHVSKYVSRAILASIHSHWHHQWNARTD